MGRGFAATDMGERKLLVAEVERILDMRGDSSSIRRARLHIQQSWIYLITDLNRANESATKGLTIYREARPTVEKVEAITSAAVIFLNLRRPADAKALLVESLAVANVVGTKANAGLPLIYVSLGIADIQLGEFASAIANSQQAFVFSRKLNGENDVTTIYAQKWLGEALVSASRFREAIDVLKVATETAVKLRGVDDAVILPEPLYVFGIALHRYGRIEEVFKKSIARH
jgi:tetratricopeptide (TPR) repeat protein